MKNGLVFPSLTRFSPPFSWAPHTLVLFPFSRASVRHPRPAGPSAGGLGSAVNDGRFHSPLAAGDNRCHEKKQKGRQNKYFLGNV